MSQSTTVPPHLFLDLLSRKPFFFVEPINGHTFRLAACSLYASVSSANGSLQRPTTHSVGSGPRLLVAVLRPKCSRKSAALGANQSYVVSVAHSLYCLDAPYICLFRQANGGPAARVTAPCSRVEKHVLRPKCLRKSVALPMSQSHVRRYWSESKMYITVVSILVPARLTWHLLTHCQSLVVDSGRHHFRCRRDCSSFCFPLIFDLIAFLLLLVHPIPH